MASSGSAGEEEHRYPSAVRVEDYDLGGELGRGAMGVVHRARHRATGAVHALKVVELVDAEAALRFEREATALARAAGPGLVPVHGVVREGRRAWLAMDLLPGGTLRQRLRERAGRPWSVPEALTLVRELARAVARCHAAGLVHRDLKPENVLFSEDGRPHVADFGLVKDLQAGSLTATGTVLGTPAYMAPEQLLGLPAGPPADVFALGAILHELLAGAPAFANLSPVARALRPAPPPAPPGTPAGRWRGSWPRPSTRRPSAARRTAPRSSGPSAESSRPAALPREAGSRGSRWSRCSWPWAGSRCRFEAAVGPRPTRPASARSLPANGLRRSTWPASRARS
jgi:serine/threonine protein kinase